MINFEGKTADRINYKYGGNSCGLPSTVNLKINSEIIDKETRLCIYEGPSILKKQGFILFVGLNLHTQETPLK